MECNTIDVICTFFRLNWRIDDVWVGKTSEKASRSRTISISVAHRLRPTLPPPSPLPPTTPPRPLLCRHRPAFRFYNTRTTVGHHCINKCWMCDSNTHWPRFIKNIGRQPRYLGAKGGNNWWNHNIGVSQLFGVGLRARAAPPSLRLCEHGHCLTLETRANLSCTIPHHY